MGATSVTSIRTTSPASGKSTCSQASVAGATPPDSPAGPTTPNCGASRVRASRSRSRANAPGPTILGIYGPTCFGSSESVAPPHSWANRFQLRLATVGSTEYLLTWRVLVTPAKRRLFRLAPSTRPIAEIDYGLWLTPATRDYKDSPGMSLAPRRDGASRTDMLPRQVYATMRALWATPTASADKSIRTPEGARREVERDCSPDLPAQTLSLWPTPTSLAPSKNGYNGAGNSAGLVAIRQIALGLYPTPTSACANGGQTSRSGKRRNEPLLRGIAMEINAVHGTTTTGSSDTTAKRAGSLAPEFVFWLMGYPRAFLDCSPPAMRSSRSLARRSSKH